MDDIWDKTVFHKTLKSIVESKKLPVSASKIETLRKLAISHPQDRNYIVQCIVQFIVKEPPEFRLAGLYVIDAISRGVQKMLRDRKGEATQAAKYLELFSRQLEEDALAGCFVPCPEKDKEKVKKTLGLWEQGDVYAKSLVNHLKHSFLAPAPPRDVRNKQHDTKDAAESRPVEKPADSTAAPINTNTLLATLSSLQSMGALSNNPTSNDPQTFATPLHGEGDAHAKGLADPSATSTLPPALAALISSLPSSSTAPPPLATPATNHVSKAPPPSSSAASRSPDPRIRPPKNDPRRQSTVDPRRSVSPPPSKDRPSRWQHSHNRRDDGRSPPHNRAMSPDGRRSPRERFSPPHDRPLPPRDQGMSPYGHFRPPLGHSMPPQAQQGGGRPPFVPWPGMPPPGVDPNRVMQQYPMPQDMGRPPPSGHAGQWQRPWMRPPFPIHPPGANGHAPHLPPRPPGPQSDPELPRGCIRVLTRTLFVGPLPDDYEKQDAIKQFSKYGELSSIILSRPPKGRSNAFLKFMTRAMVERVMKDSHNIAIDGRPVKVGPSLKGVAVGHAFGKPWKLNKVWNPIKTKKVNWAFGFGPRKLFSYDSGESIIPLNELTDDDKANLTTAPIGGFQGQPVCDRFTIEEPEVQYNPVWKKDDMAGGGGARPPARWDDGTKRSMNHDHDRSHPGPKKRRFDDDPHHYGPETWQSSARYSHPPPQMDPYHQGMHPPPPNFPFPPKHH